MSTLEGTNDLPKGVGEAPLPETRGYTESYRVALFFRRDLLGLGLREEEDAQPSAVDESVISSSCCTTELCILEP